MARKYGNVHKQLRALTVLDGLIENAGPRFQRVFADEPLLERLRVAATDSLSDLEVKKKCSILFRQWAATYQSTPGMERIVALHKQLPRRKRPPTQENSRVVQETEREVQADPFGNNDYRDAAPPLSAQSSSYATPTSATLAQGPSLTPLGKPEKSKRRKSKSKPFNLEKEKPQLLQAIASSSVASTNLMNALKLINREHKRVGEDPEALKRFENCKLLRRQILRYIQYVESEQWLGSLIHANDELVNALMAFEVLDKSVEDDSDSEDDWNSDGPDEVNDGATRKHAQQSFAGLTIGKASTEHATLNGKARANDESEDGEESDMEEEDEDDPFADRNAVSDPRVERPGMTWYVHSFNLFIQD